MSPGPVEGDPRPSKAKAALAATGPVHTPPHTLPVEASFVLSNFSKILSRGQQTLDLKLIGLPADCHVEDIKLTSDDNAFTAEAKTAKTKKTPSGTHLPIILKTTSGLQHGTYDLDISIHLMSAQGMPRLFEGSTRLPVLDLPHVQAMQGSQGHQNVNIHLAGDASLLDFRGAHVGPPIGLGNSHSSEHHIRSFEGELIEKPLVPTASCVAACMTMAETAPYRYVRLFALKNTVLGRLMTAPDVTEAAIQIDPPAGEKHDQMLSYISRQHAVIRLNGSRFDLDTLGKWGITVDTDRLGKDSPPKALKVGQVLRMPGVFPEGCVVLEVLAAARHTLILANREKGELLVIVAPGTKPAAIPAGWNPTVPIFFHHQGSFWLQDSVSHKETQITVGQDIALGASGKGKLVDHPYPELSLIDYTPGTYADKDVVSA